MHFALRGYLFVALTALLGVASTWSDVPAFAGAWLLPASLLLLGLAIEAWYLRGTQVDFSEALTGGGFKISNPNAKQSCGCGKSFET